MSLINDPLPFTLFEILTEMLFFATRALDSHHKGRGAIRTWRPKHLVEVRRKLKAGEVRRCLCPK